MGVAGYVKDLRPDKMSADELANYFGELLDMIEDHVFAVECSVKKIREEMDNMQHWVDEVKNKQ